MTAEDLALLDRALLSPEGTGTFQWFGFTSAVRLRSRLDEDGLLGPDGGMLAVHSAGRAVGRVEWFASSWGRASSSCWSIAIGIAAEHRGRGVGTRAQALLVEHLFASTRAERIQAFTDVENEAERRALRRAGFEEEGVLRRAQWRDGGWHDLVLASVLRS
ncbi:GNAT family N-acetyltransferase [Rathayibacter tanaceti]|nr:GNAT family N-acetyltransferase [Rathayibacter tanaceti]